MSNRLHAGPGRPTKFGRPSRAVTVTLPEDVLARLRAIDTDVGRAIVALAERPRRGRVHAIAPAELTTYGSHAVIVVNPARALKRLEGVQLVPVGNGRSLISLANGYSIAQLELDLRDAIDRAGSSDPGRATLEAIADILRQIRQSPALALEERRIIVIDSGRHRSSKPAASASR